MIVTLFHQRFISSQLKPLIGNWRNFFNLVKSVDLKFQLLTAVHLPKWLSQWFFCKKGVKCESNILANSYLALDCTIIHFLASRAEEVCHLGTDSTCGQKAGGVSGLDGLGWCCGWMSCIGLWRKGSYGIAYLWKMSMNWDSLSGLGWLYILLLPGQVLDSVPDTILAVHLSH